MKEVIVFVDTVGWEIVAVKNCSRCVIAMY